MEVESEQMENMGGNSNLPKIPADFKIKDFVLDRAKELACLTESIENVGSSNKRVFQQLPRHMRRRVMSHNIKRIPRRLREIHKREIEKCGNKSSKRPSRKYRRRPRNLLQEYNRRQRNYIWLETHIWHAKRFRMMSRWGCKIPLHPNDKCFRACYRSATHYALLQDISYYCCIELSGSEEDLLNVLGKLTSELCGLTFASKMYLDGSREGHTMIYKRDRYPFDAICPVSFIWRSYSAHDRTLWIWTHPSSFQELLDEFIDCFQLKKQEDGDNTTPETKKEELDCKQKLELLDQKDFAKLSPKLKQFYESTSVFENGRRKLTVLKDTLVRFRLVGQMSTAVLTKTLKVEEISAEPLSEKQESQLWWQRFSLNNQDTMRAQAKLWADIKSYPFSSRVPPNSVFGFIVRDPRESLPLDRNKFLPDIPTDSLSAKDRYISPNSYGNCSLSPVWNQSVRDEVTFTKMNDAEMNKLREQNPVPGTTLNLGDKGSRIPILLINRSGSKETYSGKGIGEGWDLIIPAGWAMAFWIPLVFRGARVGGYREHCFVARESESLHFPDDFPDTLSCKMMEDEDFNELAEKYLRYPPNKRPNFVKLGACTPFSFPWNSLVLTWAKSLLQSNELPKDPQEVKFFVLRDRKIRKQLQNFQQNIVSRKRFKAKYDSSVEISEENRYTVLNEETLSKLWNSVIYLRLRMRLRGNAERFSMVCALTFEDYDALSRDPNYPGPCEAKHQDDKGILRKEIKRLRKTKRKDNSDNPLETEVSEMLGIGTDPLRDFHVSHLSNLAECCSRPIIGYCTAGSFSLTESKVTGTAFVSVVALVNILKLSASIAREPMVLLRSPHSNQYRFADLAILI